jgi:hypothetical protein
MHRTDNIATDYITAQYQELWQAVLARAVLDRQYNCNDRHRKYANEYSLKIRQEAQDFLAGDSIDYQLVCEMAGVRPSMVKRIGGKV